MRVKGYLHTALLVTDLEQAERFWGGVLGLAKVERSLNFPGVWYQVGDIQIHLIAAAAAGQAQLGEKWGRNRHVALAVDDLQAAKAQLLAAGCPVQMSASGRAALFTADPDGNIVELGQA